MGTLRQVTEEQREPGPAEGHAQAAGLAQLQVKRLRRPRICPSIIQKAHSKVLSINHQGDEQTSSG